MPCTIRWSGMSLILACSVLRRRISLAIDARALRERWPTATSDATNASFHAHDHKNVVVTPSPEFLGRWTWPGRCSRCSWPAKWNPEWGEVLHDPAVGADEITNKVGSRSGSGQLIIAMVVHMDDLYATGSRHLSSHTGAPQLQAKPE